MFLSPHAILVLASFLTILVVILLSVTVHEFGHFVALRAMKVKVLEFAIGFGPKLYAWKGRKTKYSLRLLPLGGYVLPASRQTSSLPGFEKVDFANTTDALSYPKKLIFVFTGVGTNILFGFVLSLFYFLMRSHFPQTRNYWVFLGETFKAVVYIFTNPFSKNAAIGFVGDNFGARLFWVIIAVNLNLALFNIIPFPPLDGWRAAEYTYERISKHTIPDRIKATLSTAGFMVLLSFSLLIFIFPLVNK